MRNRLGVCPSETELHNPTAKEIKAKVKNDPRFNLLTLDREVLLLHASLSGIFYTILSATVK